MQAARLGYRLQGWGCRLGGVVWSEAEKITDIMKYPPRDLDM